MNSTARGLLAGIAGTVALNVITYGDMALRGRPSSNVPAQVAGRLADKVGIDPIAESAEGEAVENRQSGVGALLGYATGLGIGVGYGLIRSRTNGLPQPLAGSSLGLAAMAMSDIPAVALGVTNPKEWGVNAWMSDLLPHLAYGFVTTTTYDRLSGR